MRWKRIPRGLDDEVSVKGNAMVAAGFVTWGAWQFGDGTGNSSLGLKDSVLDPHKVDG